MTATPFTGLPLTEWVTQTTNVDATCQSIQGQLPDSPQMASAMFGIPTDKRIRLFYEMCQGVANGFIVNDSPSLAALTVSEGAVSIPIQERNCLTLPCRSTYWGAQSLPRFSYGNLTHLSNRWLRTKAVMLKGKLDVWRRFRFRQGAIGAVIVKSIGHRPTSGRRSLWRSIANCGRTATIPALLRFPLRGRCAEEKTPAASAALNNDVTGLTTEHLFYTITVTHR